MSHSTYYPTPTLSAPSRRRASTASTASSSTASSSYGDYRRVRRYDDTDDTATDAEEYWPRFESRVHNRHGSTLPNPSTFHDRSSSIPAQPVHGPYHTSSPPTSPLFIVFEMPQVWRDNNGVVQNVKRPANAFVLYRKHKLQQLKEEHKQAGTKLPPQAIVSKQLGEMWGNESEDIKSRWKFEADLVKAKFEAEHPNSQYRPEKRQDKDRRRAKTREEKEQEKKTKRKVSQAEKRRIEHVAQHETQAAVATTSANTLDGSRHYRPHTIHTTDASSPSPISATPSSPWSPASLMLPSTPPTNQPSPPTEPTGAPLPPVQAPKASPAQDEDMTALLQSLAEQTYLDPTDPAYITLNIPNAADAMMWQFTNFTEYNPYLVPNNAGPSVNPDANLLGVDATPPNILPGVMSLDLNFDIPLDPNQIIPGDINVSAENPYANFDMSSDDTDVWTTFDMGNNLFANNDALTHFNNGLVHNNVHATNTYSANGLANTIPPVQGHPSTPMFTYMPPSPPQQHQATPSSSRSYVPPSGAGNTNRRAGAAWRVPVFSPSPSPIDRRPSYTSVSS